MFVLGFSISFGVTWKSNNESLADSASPNASNLKQASIQYTDNVSISIEYDSDFRAQAAINGWDRGGSQDGTASKPYIIDNANFTGSSTLIRINHTDVYFYINNCIISGSGYIGIYFEDVSNGFIINNNIFSNNDSGIVLYQSNNITVAGNHIVNNAKKPYNSFDAIYVSQSSNNTIKDNDISNNHNSGIRISSLSHNNTIRNNTLSTNGGTAVYVSGASKDNVITNNTIVDNGPYGGSGVYLEIGPQGTTITDNIIVNCFDYGIGLSGSIGNGATKNNIISGNSISNCQYGLVVLSSAANTIIGNYVTNNTQFGIYVHTGPNAPAEDNIIENNDFVNNKYEFGASGYPQAWDDGSSNTFAGNYWDEWVVPDANTNSIVDNPYPINGSANNKDNTPVTSPNTPGLHVLSRPRIIAPNTGGWLSGTITIDFAESKDSLGHTATYSIYYTNNSGSTWHQITSGLTATSYNLDTLTIPYQYGEGWTYAEAYDIWIKVVADGSGGLTAVDYTDFAFNIRNVIETSTSTSTSVDTNTGPQETPWLSVTIFITAAFALAGIRMGRKKKN